MATGISYNQLVISVPLTFTKGILDSGLDLPNDFFIALELNGDNRSYEQHPKKPGERLARSWGIISDAHTEQALLNWACQSGDDIESGMMRCGSVIDGQGMVTRWRNRFVNCLWINQSELNWERMVAGKTITLSVREPFSANAQLDPRAQQLVDQLEQQRRIEKVPNSEASYTIALNNDNWPYIATLVHSGGFYINHMCSPFTAEGSYAMESVTPQGYQKRTKIKSLKRARELDWIYRPRAERIDAINTPAPAQEDAGAQVQTGSFVMAEQIEVVVNKIGSGLLHVTDYDTLSREFTLPVTALPTGAGLGTAFMVAVSPDGSCRAI